MGHKSGNIKKGEMNPLEGDKMSMIWQDNWRREKIRVQKKIL